MPIGNAVWPLQGPDLEDLHDELARRDAGRDRLAHTVPDERTSEGGVRRQHIVVTLFLTQPQQVGLRLIVTLVFDGNELAGRYYAVVLRLDNLRVLEHLDDLTQPRLLHPLLLSSSVVLGVLAEITVLARGSDRLDHFLTTFALEVAALRLQAFKGRLRQGNLLFLIN